MKIRGYIYHKQSERYSDCQDFLGANLSKNRIAISDGITQSIFPQWWAKLLVDHYLEEGSFPSDLKPLQQKWQQQVKDEIVRIEKEGINPWSIKNRIADENGAGATLCGLTWTDSNWSCECLGDSTLIAIHKDFSLRFYTSQIGEFGNRPDYFDSFSTGRGESVKKDGNFSVVLALLLVTDPFSEFFQRHELDPDFIRERLEELQNLTDHESFVSLVERWRNDFSMHDDDSTLVIIHNFESVGADEIYIDNITKLCEKEASGQNYTTGQQNKDQTLIESHINNVNMTIGNISATENLIKSFKIWLSSYEGKKSKNKIMAALTKIINPILKNYSYK